jgi:hypothetical protein
VTDQTGRPCLPRFPDAIKFVIGTFGQTFGSSDGAKLRAWTALYNWTLVWALGDVTALDKHNKDSSSGLAATTSDITTVTDATITSRHAAVPPAAYTYLANQRVVDPLFVGASNFTASAAARDAFDAVWVRTHRVRPRFQRTDGCRVGRTPAPPPPTPPPPSTAPSVLAVRSSHFFDDPPASSIPSWSPASRLSPSHQHSSTRRPINRLSCPFINSFVRSQGRRGRRPHRERERRHQQHAGSRAVGHAGPGALRGASARRRLRQRRARCGGALRGRHCRQRRLRVLPFVLVPLVILVVLSRFGRCEGDVRDGA